MTEADPPLRLEYLDPADLEANSLNWRTHPVAQTTALQAIMDEVGWAGALLYNERTKRLIDGHARKKLFEGKGLVPVLVGSWDEATERKILASLDPLAALAQANGAMLGSLLQSIETQSADVREFLEGVAATNQAFGTEDAGVEANEEQAADSREDSEKLAEFIRLRQQSTERGNDKLEVNFWVCLVFQSYDQKWEFLQKIADVPVLYGMYADGEAFATRVGLPVTPNLQRNFNSPLDKKLAAMVTLDQETVI